MKPVFYYCYDAWCGWCYGFSPVIRQIALEYQDRYHFEVLSGGMILPETPAPISTMAGFIRSSYQTVEEYTGIRFGKDYLWHIENPELSDWFPNSEKPAVALCVFKEFFPEQQVAFAADMEYALHREGRDLCDDEAYRHLLEKYQLDPDRFYEKLHDDAYKEKAYYEFALCKQLKITGFPTLLLQVTDQKLYLLSRGYSPLETVQARIESVIREQSAIT